MVDLDAVLDQLKRLSEAVDTLRIASGKHGTQIQRHAEKFTEITSTLPLEERFGIVSDSIADTNKRLHEMESHFYKGQYDKQFHNLVERVDDISSELESIGDTLADYRQTLARHDERLDLLTQELDSPVMSLEEAEIDLVGDALNHASQHVSDVISLFCNQLITKEEARKLMGFKS